MNTATTTTTTITLDEGFLARRNWLDWKEWLGKRAQAGRQGPRGLRKFR